MITIKQLYDWVQLHRRRTAFDYPDNILLDELVWCCDNDSLLCLEDENGIQGIVCWKLDIGKRVMLVMDILVNKPGVVKDMMKVFHLRFPNFTIEGFNRNKRHRNFNNTTKLLNRL